ncbi:MAG TPA: LytTR family DNA-binding domain-containing protein [Thermoanaerobaculia bacterium]|nr:LytTR family DNA-binding domain-containing protein [Thermoanaerobaculia bacterium]
MAIRALIVDDEFLARQRIEDLLRNESDIEVIGIAGNGNEAVEKIRELRPDLVFLDVQMPGMSGTEVAAAIGDEMPATIFVTAFDRHAVKAFELQALDYLVKPFDDERFGQAVLRAKKRMPAAGYLQRIAVEIRGQTRVLPVEMIDYISASGPYAELHVGDRSFAVRERMAALEERLDPDRFFRVHRSAIVQLDRVDALLRGSGGDYAVRLKNGVEVSLSRSRREALEAKLGL